MSGLLEAVLTVALVQGAVLSAWYLVVDLTGGWE